MSAELRAGQPVHRSWYTTRPARGVIGGKFGERESSMNFKVILAVSMCTALPVVASAQQNRLAVSAPKPTVADVEKLAQMISGDKVKLKAYCDIANLQEQMEKAKQNKDEKAFEALNAKADNLAEQIGPEYIKVITGLEEVDPDSSEGKKFEALFNSLDKQCK